MKFAAQQKAKYFLRSQPDILHKILIILSDSRINKDTEFILKTFKQNIS